MRYLWLLVLVVSPLLALAQSNPLESVLKALPDCGVCVKLVWALHMKDSC